MEDKVVRVSYSPKDVKGQNGLRPSFYVLDELCCIDNSITVEQIKSMWTESKLKYKKGDSLPIYTGTPL